METVGCPFDPALLWLNVWSEAIGYHKFWQHELGKPAILVIKVPLSAQVDGEALVAHIIGSRSGAVHTGAATPRELQMIVTVSMDSSDLSMVAHGQDQSNSTTLAVTADTNRLEMALYCVAFSRRVNAMHLCSLCLTLDHGAEGPSPCTSCLRLPPSFG